jgi:hypothetical protein
VNKHIKRLLSPLNEVESQREEDYRVSSGWLHCAPHCSSSAAIIATFPVLQSVGPKRNSTTDQKLKNFRFIASSDETNMDFLSSRSN